MKQMQNDNLGVCNRSFTHFSNFKRYVLYSETSKFRGRRIAMPKGKLLKTLRIRCGKRLCDVPWHNSAHSLIHYTVCLKDLGKEVKGKWTVQSQTHFPLLYCLETLLLKFSCGTTLVIYAVSGKYILTSYKRQ